MDPQASPVTSLYPAGYPDFSAVGSAVNLTLFVAGTPVPKGRPRTRVQTPKDPSKRAWAQIYTDEATVGWEDMIINQTREQLARLSIMQPAFQGVVFPLSGRALITLRFNFDKPKSAPKSVQYPVKSRTDWDNLAKCVCDALQGADILQNDSMITDAVTLKRFSEPGHPRGVEIDLTVLGN